MKKFNKNLSLLLISAVSCTVFNSCGKKSYDYAMINSPEEAGMIFTRITPENATVVASSTFAGKYLAVDKNNKNLIYLTKAGNNSNINLVDLDAPSVSQQRTFRNNVVGGFDISPDGEDILFVSGKEILMTNISSGSICKQITSGNNDNCPTFNNDASVIYFHRLAAGQSSSSNIWSYDVNTKEMSMYGDGFCPTPGSDDYLYTLKDVTKNGRSFTEIRRINTKSAANDIILSNEDYNPAQVSISPNGKWLAFSANRKTNGKWGVKQVFVMRTDGTELTQITYHQGENHSPIWADDSTIYFISGRGNKDKKYGVWRTSLSSIVR